MKNYIGYHAVVPRIDELHRQAEAARLAAEYRRSAPARRVRKRLGGRRRGRRLAPAGRSLQA